jgi:hypothetical protein
MIILQQTRGLLSSNDELALDLPLAETKSITARVGPTPVFTRASSGTYFGPLVQFDDQTYPTVGIVNGRAEWKIVDGSNYTSFYYHGDRWRYEDFYFGEGTTFDSAVTAAFRPEQADWSGSGLGSSPTTSSTFGIVRAATNEPRFEHDPLTGVCGGLLLEQSRTNLFLQSADFSTTWTKIQVAVSTNVTTSPSGDVTADKVVPNLASTISRVSQAFTLTGSHSMSVFAKSSEWGWLFIGPTSGNVGVWFDLSNGTVGTQSSGFVGSIVSFGNGWYRCAVSFTGVTTLQPTRIVPTNADNTITTGDGTSGIFIWGAQLEAGATATSYIPTTTGSLARSQDLYTITGADFTDMYNQNEGTVFYAVRAVGATTAQSGVFGIHGAPRSGGGVSGVFSGIQITNSVYGASFTSQASFANAASRNTLVKNAIAFRTDDFANSFNGNIATDTSGTLLTIFNRFVIGATGNTGGPQIGNNIFSSVQYYRKRLPNPKLQALTQ